MTCGNVECLSIFLGAEGGGNDLLSVAAQEARKVRMRMRTFVFDHYYPQGAISDLRHLREIECCCWCVEKSERDQNPTGVPTGLPRVPFETFILGK